MSHRAPLRGRTQRGSSAYILILAIVVLAGTFVFSTITSGTTGISTEAARVDQDRAHWNAYSGALEAEAAAQREVPPALENLLASLQGTADWSMPVLTGLKFPEITYDFSFASRPGCTADDHAEVAGTLTLAGPPDQIIKAGVEAGGAVQHFEHYTFTLDLVSTGYSSGDAKQIARQTGTFFVDIETVPGLVDSTSTGSGGIGGGPIVGVSSVHWPRKRFEPPSVFNLASFNAGNLQVVELADTYTQSPGGSAHGTPWTGPPVLDHMGSPIGLPHGNKPYVFYIKGLPKGTIVESRDTATILGYDDWRFSSSFVAGSDTYDCGDRTAESRRYGTPRYAVVVVNAPGAIRYYPRSGARLRDQATLTLPGGSRFTLQIPTSDTTWAPMSPVIKNASGSDVVVTGEGSYLAPPQEATGVLAAIDWGSSLAPQASNERPNGALQSWNIQVPGYKQDLPPTLFGSGNNNQRGETLITLATVTGKPSLLDLSFSGGTTTTIATATHSMFEPEATGGNPINPPSPCCDPPPPARARRWIVAYKTGTIRFLRRSLVDVNGGDGN